MEWDLTVGLGEFQAISAKSGDDQEEDQEDGSSVSRSFLSISSARKENDGGDDLSRSI